ncbi:MAG: hypothetical protein M3O31_06935 [Acidobacteriota bacterium]|nr:hypothetical protein [Acidobacteriota bacterium]
MRRPVRILLWILTPVFTVALMLGGLFFVFWRHFYPSPPKFSYPAAANALEAQRQDLDYFDKLIAMDRAFTPESRAEAERRVIALKALPAPLDGPHLLVALMLIDALADNGHSKVSFGPGATPKELPVRVQLFSDGLYVMRAQEADRELLGGRVVAIDGMPIDSVMQRLETLRGGTQRWRAEYATVYVNVQDLLYGLGIAKDMQHSTWTVATSAGAIVTRTLGAYQPASDEPSPWVTRWYSSEPLAGLTDGWAAFEPDEPLPVTLTNFDNTFRRERLRGSCTMLVQFKSNTDEGKDRIGPFVRETEADMRQDPPCNVILDMRFDDGGDYMNTYGFAKSLPNMIQQGGHIYVLTGPSTFSAGITTVAWVKQAAGDRMSILGEPVGDRMAFYSEGNRGCLPNSKLCVAYRTGKHDYQYACTDLRDCFWLNYVYAARVKTLEPDERIAQSFADWRAGRDPVFERAVALAGK